MSALWTLKYMSVRPSMAFIIVVKLVPLFVIIGRECIITEQYLCIHTFHFIFYLINARNKLL